MILFHKDFIDRNNYNSTFENYNFFSLFFFFLFFFLFSRVYLGRSFEAPVPRPPLPSRPFIPLLSLSAGSQLLHLQFDNGARDRKLALILEAVPLGTADLVTVKGVGREIIPVTSEQFFRTDLWNLLLVALYLLPLPLLAAVQPLLLLLGPGAVVRRPRFVHYGAGDEQELVGFHPVRFLRVEVSVGEGFGPLGGRGGAGGRVRLALRLAAILVVLGGARLGPGRGFAAVRGAHLAPGEPSHPQALLLAPRVLVPRLGGEGGGGPALALQLLLLLGAARRAARRRAAQLAPLLRHPLGRVVAVRPVHRVQRLLHYPRGGPVLHVPRLHVAGEVVLVGVADHAGAGAALVHPRLHDAVVAGGRLVEGEDEGNGGGPVGVAGHVGLEAPLGAQPSRAPLALPRVALGDPRRGLLPAGRAPDQRDGRRLPPCVLLVLAPPLPRPLVQPRPVHYLGGGVHGVVLPLAHVQGGYFVRVVHGRLLRGDYHRAGERPVRALAGLQRVRHRHLPSLLVLLARQVLLDRFYRVLLGVTRDPAIRELGLRIVNFGNSSYWNYYWRRKHFEFKFESKIFFVEIEVLFCQRDLLFG